MTALGGYDVIVQDINEEATDLARFEMIDGRWGMKASVQKGKITYQACEDAIPRLTTTLDQADLADCDLIIEAVPCAPLSSRIHPSLGCCRWSPPQSMAADDVLPCREKLELKQDVFAALDKICKPSCIFTSNTSGFVIEEVAAKCSVRPTPSPSKPCAQPLCCGFGRRLQTTDKQL